MAWAQCPLPGSVPSTFLSSRGRCCLYSAGLSLSKMMEVPVPCIFSHSSCMFHKKMLTKVVEEVTHSSVRDYRSTTFSAPGLYSTTIFCQKFTSTKFVNKMQLILYKSTIYNFHQSLENIDTHLFVSYLQSTTFLGKNNIYNVHGFTLNLQRK